MELLSKGVPRVPLNNWTAEDSPWKVCPFYLCHETGRNHVLLEKLDSLIIKKCVKKKSFSFQILPSIKQVNVRYRAVWTVSWGAPSS